MASAFLRRLGVALAFALAASAQPNLLTNGSFEVPVTAGFFVYTAIPGWTATRGCGMEIQAGSIAGTPADDDQLIELDSHDLFGTGCNTSSEMTQTVATIPGASYILRYAFSPRP